MIYTKVLYYFAFIFFSFTVWFLCSFHFASSLKHPFSIFVDYITVWNVYVWNDTVIHTEDEIIISGMSVGYAAKAPENTLISERADVDEFAIFLE